MLAFARRGLIDFRGFALPALAAFAGSAGGAFLLTRIDPDFLSGLIPLLLVAIACYYLFAPKMGEEDRHVIAGPRRLVALLVVTAILIGAYDGFFGPGTGSFFTTCLVVVFGLGITRAVAHTKLLNFASNLAGLAVLIIAGQVVWVIGLSMAVASIAGGQMGAWLAMRFGASAVRPLLVVMCLALTARLLMEPGNPLVLAIARWFA